MTPSTKRQSQDNLHVGVISDTHGVLLPAAAAALEGVDLIIHAGDVGSIEIIEELQTVAPVVAVRGNMDAANDLQRLPDTEIVEIGDVLLYVIHDLHRIDLTPSKAGFNAVIFGHLHWPSIAQQNGVLYLNPGSATQPRRSYPASLAMLNIQGKDIKAKIIHLDDQG